MLTNSTSSNKRFILASASPRRSELLSHLGVEFDIIPANTVEIIELGEEPVNAAARLSLEKALSVSKDFPDAVVLGADTLVVLPRSENGSAEVLGKPRDEEEACRMLGRLQAREHIVITGFSVVCLTSALQRTEAVESKVVFRPIDEQEIRAYVKSGEPLDKAGAYGVQGKGGIFVKGIYGSYTNVMGLPLSEVVDALKEIGMWQCEMLSL